jgi:predicted DCC family thiol-disulfide oxidoreductase YuxK
VEPRAKVAAPVSGGMGGAERALLGATGRAREERIRWKGSKGGRLAYTHTKQGDQNGNPGSIWIPMKNNKAENVILFDGVCNLCNGWVRFVLERDHKRNFLFASLQSDIAQSLARQFNFALTDFDSIILIENPTYSIKSEAALKILKGLGGVWSLFSIFTILPQSWRDSIYDFVAKNRYRWFGKLERCMVPTPDMRSRFLD